MVPVPSPLCVAAAASRLANVICEGGATVVEVVDEVGGTVVGTGTTVVDVDGGTEVEVLCPVNAIGHDGLFPASRFS
jgi:hypothetical protein